MLHCLGIVITPAAIKSRLDGADLICSQFSHVAEVVADSLMESQPSPDRPRSRSSSNEAPKSFVLGASNRGFAGQFPIHDRLKPAKTMPVTVHFARTAGQANNWLRR